MNLSARSLFGLWTWHISIQYSRITVLPYKTSHFFFMDLFYILKYGPNSQCVFLCFSDQLLGRKHLVWSQLKRTELTGRWQWKSELPENQTIPVIADIVQLCFEKSTWNTPSPFFFKSTPNNFTVFYIQNLYTVLWGTNAVWWRKAALLASLRLLLSLYDICTFFCYHKWVCFAGQSVFKMGTCNIFLHSNLKGTYYAIFSLGHLIYFSSSKLQLRVICPE